MYDRVEIFVELGRRLESFGSDSSSKYVIAHAIEENGWFSESDIRFAVAAIREKMLDRAKLESQLSHYTLPVAKPLNTGVICAGNIPLAGFFDLLCVLVSGHNLLLKPSSGDSVLMRHIVGLLKDIDPSIPVGEFGEVSALIASGSDTTIGQLRSLYGDIPAIFRGTRRSAAILEGDESKADLKRLCYDIFLYSGLGCRSVSHLFVPHGYDFEPLCSAMQNYRDINPKYKSGYRQLRSLLVMEEIEFINCGDCALLHDDGLSHKINLIHFSYYNTREDIADIISKFISPLQCIVSGDGFPCFGDAQRPELYDFPDSIDTLSWLSELQEAVSEKILG